MRSKKKLQTILESRTARPPGCTVRSKSSSRSQSFTGEQHQTPTSESKISQAQDTRMPKRLERKIASLNFEKDGRKFWKLTKQLSDEENSRAKITLKENSKLLTGKQAADKFAENYANESKIPISALKQREARREIRERTANRTAVKPMHQPLRLGELQRALKKLTKEVARTRWHNQ